MLMLCFLHAAFLCQDKFAIDEEAEDGWFINKTGGTREKRVANGLPLDLITGKMQKRLESDVSSKIHKEEYYDS